MTTQTALFDTPDIAERRRATVAAAVRFRAALARKRGGYLRGDNAATRWTQMNDAGHAQDALRRTLPPYVADTLITAILAEHNALVFCIATDEGRARYRAGARHNPQHRTSVTVRAALAAALAH